MALISPTPRAGSWIEITWALAPFPTPRAGSWLAIEGSLSETPRAGSWLKVVGQPGSGTVRAGSWLRIDAVLFVREQPLTFVGEIGAPPAA